MAAKSIAPFLIPFKNVTKLNSNVNTIQIRNKWWSNTPIKTNTNYKVVMPGNVSKQIAYDMIPNHIILPPYAKSGIPPQITEKWKKDSSLGYTEIKSDEYIERMKKACQLAKSVLTQAGDMVRVGLTTDEIDQLVFDLSIAHNAYPSPLNYRGFPKAVCTSVNNVICHGIPDDRPLCNGDIVNIDVTVYIDGVHGDCSKTFLVGEVDEDGKRLVSITEECLKIGVEICKPGTKFSDIGQAIYNHAQKYNYEIVPQFTGHGIGYYFHGPPDVYHVPNTYPGKMKPGMTFTIEPILTEGTDEMVILEDGWTALTCDNSRAAQCEHTVLITEEGVEVLTE